MELLRRKSPISQSLKCMMMRTRRTRAARLIFEFQFYESVACLIYLYIYIFKID